VAADKASDFVGFVEGGDPGDRADVIVTDGFADRNVALKTG
jgi:fatty acid/phospholipid biosynthesis enzyme